MKNKAAFLPYCACLVALSLASFAHATDAPAKTINFTIIDRLDPEQLDEQIAVSINNLPVGQLKIDKTKPADTLTVKIPAAAVYHYDLCGLLNMHGPEGHAVPHKIDSGEDFVPIEGHQFEANNANAVMFYLTDNTESKLTPYAHRITINHSCRSTVAMNTVD